MNEKGEAGYRSICHASPFCCQRVSLDFKTVRCYELLIVCVGIRFTVFLVFYDDLDPVGAGGLYRECVDVIDT